jgi:hypothetical protein
MKFLLVGAQNGAWGRAFARRYARRNVPNVDCYTS